MLGTELMHGATKLSLLPPEVEENTKGCSRSQWQSQAFRGQHGVHQHAKQPSWFVHESWFGQLQGEREKGGQGKTSKTPSLPLRGKAGEATSSPVIPPQPSGCAKGTSAPRHYLTADITGVVMAMIYARISHCSTSTIDWRTIGKNAHFKVPVIQRLRVGENRLDSFHPSDSSSDI